MAQLSAQLQEMITLLTQASQSYGNAANDTGTVSAEALAGGMDLAQNWQGKASQSFLNSLGRLADDTGRATNALLEMSGILSTLASTITSNLAPIQQYESALQQGTTTIDTMDPLDPYVRTNTTTLASDLQAKIQASQVQRDQALRNIYDAANSAASELDQITAIGTCSTIIMNRISDWFYIGSSLTLLASTYAYLSNNPAGTGSGSGGKGGTKGKMFNCLAFPTNSLLNFLTKILLKYPRLMTGVLGKTLASFPALLASLTSSLKSHGLNSKAIVNPQFIASLTANFLVGSIAWKIIAKTQMQADEICAIHPDLNKNELKTAIQQWLTAGFLAAPISLSSATIVSLLPSSFFDNPHSDNNPHIKNTYIGDYHGYHIYEIGSNVFVPEKTAPTSTHAVAPSITQNSKFQWLVQELKNNGQTSSHPSPSPLK